MSTDITVVDFKDYGLHVNNPKSVKSSVLEKIAEDLYHAFTTTGLCYIVNHGVPQSMIDKLFSISKTFFTQPVEEKQKFSRGRDTSHGYEALGRESLNPDRVGDYKEAFNYFPCEDGEWPDNLPDFKSAFMNLFEQCKLLTERVLHILAIGLKLQFHTIVRSGLHQSFMHRLWKVISWFPNQPSTAADTSYIAKCHSLIGQMGNHTALRSLYYPPLPSDGSVKPGQVRCGEHSDYGTVTLLFQDDVGGLEVQNADGVYVHATPMPGSVVVNIGDLLQHWTSDLLVSNKHRVLIPEEEMKKNQDRQSVAFFVNSDDDVMITPLDGSNKYEPVTAKDYINAQFRVTQHV